MKGPALNRRPARKTKKSSRRPLPLLVIERGVRAEESFGYSIS